MACARWGVKELGNRGSEVGIRRSPVGRRDGGQVSGAAAPNGIPCDEPSLRPIHAEIADMSLPATLAASLALLTAALPTLGQPTGTPAVADRTTYLADVVKVCRTDWPNNRAIF